ncbi:prolyl-tRNA synthetase associated domain-containing protein 1 isoform X2 [Triticum urartu]|uniref:YbaK/aminoacyl-tRNA synthetase-associated domain-containing protein n=1 Tax=Triticum urartu TaxID=4572 RepID=A0A8R7QTJ6_TRIUA|nr:prolyl-tRNA synthetase associated domain-containing protein 1 isoform X2 [Triticum urartu]
MGRTKDELLARLEELKIDFKRYDHPVVLTVEEQAKHVGNFGGALTKNLLLKDKKHRLYIVSALADTKVDMKILSQRLGLGKGGVRMAPEENLRQVLQVPLGCVTPFALFNESASAVSLLLDQGFKSKQSCYFHPLTNDVTIALSSSNLDKFLLSIGKQPAYVDLEASPVVGKDNPPDLADLVPSGAFCSSEESVENPTPKDAPQVNVPKEKTCLPVKAKPKVQKKGAESSESKVPTNNGANVEIFASDVLEVIFPLFLSEASKKLNIKQEELTQILKLDDFKRRAAPDLESVTNMFKNAAYTAGFHAGFDTMLKSGLGGMPPRK